jgi:galactose mutarotase-like enzyme
MLSTIENGTLRAGVKSKGAELSSIKNIASGREFIWQGDPDIWSPQSPLLFPIVGRVNGGVYRLGGKQYEMPKHGFARNSEFELVKVETAKLIYEMTDSDETEKFYPYKFALRIIYTLDENTLKVGFEVENRNDSRIYFSIGAHPAFACPVEREVRLEDYYLEFEEDETAGRWYIEDGALGRCDEKFLDNEKRIGITNELFKDDALIFKGLKSSSVRLRCEKSDREVRIDFPGFKYLGIWAKAGAPYVCIEPWFGLDDNRGFGGDFSEKEGIEKLETGQIFGSEYTITCR